MTTSRNEPNRATCPDIDRAIALMEDLRASNGTLRDWGNGLVSDLEDQDEKIEKLEARIDELEDELMEVRTMLEATK